jgi:succinate dehydrogenase hydrophobic anchor subunit
MGGWHAVEGFISEAGKHSTWAGKFYNTFFDVFRLLFLVSIVDNTFKGSKKLIKENYRLWYRSIPL